MSHRRQPGTGFRFIFLLTLPLPADALPGDQFKIPYGQHHRAGDDAQMCARLFLRELEDVGWCGWEGMEDCGGKL